MTLDQIRARAQTPGSPFHLREQDRDRLLAAVDAALALHTPITVYEIDPMNGAWVYGDDDERKVMTVLCSECTPDHVLGDVDESEYDGPNDVDVCWPCPTVAAITKALEGETMSTEEHACTPETLCGDCLAYAAEDGEA